MLSSGILDFAIGLVFTFLAVSLAAGAATEAFSSFLKTRSTTLLQGITDLLNDPNFNALAGELYQHGLINPRGDGSKPDPADPKKAEADRKNNPSYIDPGQFASALLDIIKGLPNTQPPDDSPAKPPSGTASAITAMNAKIANAPGDEHGQLRKMLYGIVERAEGDEEKIRKELATWFDNSMDRVSGSYKRWTQRWNFFFALGIAVVLNVNTLDVAKTLWKQPVDTKAISAVSDATKLPAYLDTLKALNGLPVGWPPQSWPDDVKHAAGVFDFAGQASKKIPELIWWLILSIVGWAVTASTTLFGAPFWFDALQQIVRLKGSGPSPGEKATNTAAANGKAPAAATPA